jgi:hypothetical protein
MTQVKILTLQAWTDDETAKSEQTLAGYLSEGWNIAAANLRSGTKGEGITSKTVTWVEMWYTLVKS